MGNSLAEVMHYLRIEGPLSRQQLIQICESDLLAGGGLKMNYITATEAILYCRGPGLEHSESYDQNRLVKWLVDNIHKM